MDEIPALHPTSPRRSRRRVWQWLLALAAVALGVFLAPPVVRFATNSAPSLEPLTKSLEAAGYDCDTTASGKRGIITDAVVCKSDVLQFDVSSHSNSQKQDEIGRFIRSGVGCSLARSRDAESFVLLTVDRVTIYVAGISAREVAERVPVLGSYLAEEVRCDVPTTSGSGPMPPSA